MHDGTPMRASGTSLSHTGAMTDYLVIERKQTITAPADTITPLILDYRRWVDWSPWEGLDPDLKRSYSGPDSGVGAGYEWAGNRKAGAGRMEITSVTPEAIDMDLTFTRPFKSASLTHFDLIPEGDHTTVVWQVRTPKTFMTRIAGLFMNMDKQVGTDLENGLSKLKSVVEN